ncbi:MAG: dephospho-CoA kinase [Nitrosomonas sp.]|nr:dephospho-CoA kinase [Nitrosomonas sp.]MDP1950018.1 dephospho-CoA kinase [Nitrosomonas sp.]
MSFVVGLTGGIGSGKTSTTKIFASLGVDIIDTDEIARALTQSDGAAIVPIRKIFGDNLITADGALDRRKMREMVFSDSILKQKLEEILHPLIVLETARRLTLTKSPYVIIAIPLLFETKVYHNLIQRVLVIDCDEQKQITRTMARSKLEEQEVRVIMAAQVSRQERLQKADDVILNNEDLDFLRKQVIDHHQKYLDLSKNYQPI